MNYREQCLQMMIHMGQNFSSEALAELIAAFADGICKSMALVNDHEDMHAKLESLHEAMHKTACHMHNDFKAMRGGLKQANVGSVDAETFLRDVFKPERFNG